MSKLLDLATIKIDYKLSGNFIAKVTLNFQEEFEIRYCRITLRPNRTLWFQPPALKEFGYAKCFGVLNILDFKKLEQRVINQCLHELEEKEKQGLISSELLEKIKRSREKEDLTEEDYKKIDEHIHNSH